MDKLKIQKNLDAFEQLLTAEQWSGLGCAIIYIPFIALFVTLPVSLVYSSIHFITGFYLEFICSSYVMALILTLGFYTYSRFQSILSIQKDLRQKRYLPITTVITKCIREERTNSEGDKYWLHSLQLDICLDKIPVKTIPLINNKTKIFTVSEATYNKQTKGKILFFIVSQHSNYWLCTDDTFQVEIGRDFFNSN